MTPEAEVLIDALEELCYNAHHEINPSTEEEIQEARGRLVAYIENLEQDMFGYIGEPIRYDSLVGKNPFTPVACISPAEMEERKKELSRRMW